MTFTPKQDAIGFLAIFTIIITLIATYITHIINTLMTGKYILLLIGVIVPPIGMLHGLGLWFGIAW